jgi:hypothetical protein
MKTDIGIKGEIYTAITTDTTLNALIGGRCHWFKPQTTTFPSITYSLLDTSASYILGGCVITSHETIDLQIDIYVTMSQMTQLSNIVDNLKRVMTSKGYMLMPNQPEILEGDLVQRATRWRLINV